MEENWSAPSFVEPFQAVKFQQGNDAQFTARVSGNPEPEIRFTMLRQTPTCEKLKLPTTTWFLCWWLYSCHRFTLQYCFKQQVRYAFYKLEYHCQIGPRWTRKGQPLISCEKYEVSSDRKSGKVTLKIRDLGPGDEGSYCCILTNPYGETTATLAVNPDVNRLRHRGLSPGCCRATLEKRIRQQRLINEAEKRSNDEKSDKSITL